MKSIFTAFFAFAFLALFSQAEAQTLGTCQIFPSNNPWNQRVDSLPVHWNSDKYIAHISSNTHVHPDFGSDPQYGIPWIAVNASQAFVPINITSSWGQSDLGPMPIPPNAKVEYPAPPNGDAHVLVVDTSNHHLYELYQGIKDKNDNGWAATSTAVYGLDSNNYRPDGWTSADAAGLPIWPGLVRKDECDAGEIKHALRFTVSTTQKGWIFPARHEAGSKTDTTYMPMGLRMRLKAKFDDSKFTGYAKVISTALKKYGIILADNGSNWYISGENNTSWPDDDIGQLKQILGTDFEAVYTGPVRTSANQYPDPVLPIPSGTPAARISVAPSIVHDTTLMGNSNAAVITISNKGQASLTINRYWLKVGTVFQISDSLNHTILQGDSTVVVVNFSPTQKGQVVDTLFISSNDLGTPTASIPLIGFGTRGRFFLSANPLNCGSVQMGSADTTWVILTNLGDGELIVNSGDFSGSNPSDFAIVAIGPKTAPPFVLMPGDTEIAGIQFTPTVAGPDTSVFAFTFAEYTGGDQDTSLTVVGVGLESSSVTAIPAEQLDFSIFPNPSDGVVTVAITGAYGSSEIEITDQIGRSVMRQSIQSGKGTLDLSGLPNGAYLARVLGASGTASQRVVLAR